MDLQIAGLTALVTGASRGIGAAVAETLAREGCHLHLASRTAADLDALKTRLLQAANVRVTCHALDLGRPEAVSRLGELCGDVDILVNNAGAIPAGRLNAVSDDRWREAWELKVFGYINLTRAIYARMCARKAGVIVNVIGVAGERLRSDYIAGSTGNAALMAFTKTLGGESVDYGVRVCGINPGMIDTDRVRSRLETKAKLVFGDAGRWRELMKNLPLGRPGRPEEIADAVAFLASARASYISGTILTVDAGRAVRNPD